VLVALQAPGLDPQPKVKIAEIGPGGQQSVTIKSNLPAPGSPTPKVRLRRAAWREPGGKAGARKSGKGPHLAPTDSPIYVEPGRAKASGEKLQRDDLGFIVSQPGD
jgi:hypothetical protein